MRQLALPYGGGKTHTLITLYHLVSDPKKLPDLPAVREFKEAFGGEPPRARVAARDYAAAGTVRIRVPKAEFSGAKGEEQKYGIGVE